jgi:hypothetical protein
MEAELFHPDRQTNMTKTIVAIRNFANEPKTKANTDLTSSTERCDPLFFNPISHSVGVHFKLQAKIGYIYPSWDYKRQWPSHSF